MADKIYEKQRQGSDNAIAKGGWSSFCIHAIVDDVANNSGEGGHYISKAQADRLFGYTESLGDRVWVATLTDAMLYHFEWSTAKVTSSYEDGKISVTLTDNENDEVFNMPLTIKVRVPGTWSVATDGTRLYEILTDSYGNKYILAEVAPETTAVPDTTVLDTTAPDTTVSDTTMSVTTEPTPEETTDPWVVTAPAGDGWSGFH